MKRPAPEECAICGGEVPPDALACPHCGADERNGWREQDYYDGVDLPTDEVERGRPAGSLPGWAIAVVGAVLLLALVLGVLGIR